MATNKPLPEFFVRVKLPAAGNYPACPSGDTDYEVDYHEALTAATPEGFEPLKPRTLERWPMDSEGRTWVPLRATQAGNAFAAMTERVKQLETQLERIRAVAT